MKKVFLTLACAISVLAVNAQDAKHPARENTQPMAAPAQAVARPPVAPAPAVAPAPDPDAGEFKFKSDTHDYGEVEEGPVAECDFEFKNVGRKPINITDAHGSCGCTVPKWPTEPILPGKKGVIHVTYSTQNRPGPIMKEVTINSNAKQSPMVLHIRGTVKPKPAAPAANTTPQPAGH